MVHSTKCLTCGHPYDRDHYSECPSCTNDHLDDYHTHGGTQ